MIVSLMLASNAFLLTNYALAMVKETMVDAALKEGAKLHKRAKGLG